MLGDGVGTNDTRTSVTQARTAAELGAALLLLRALQRLLLLVSCAIT